MEEGTVFRGLAIDLFKGKIAIVINVQEFDW